MTSSRRHPVPSPPMGSSHEQVFPSARSLLPEPGSDPVAAVRAGLLSAILDRIQSHLDVSDARLALILGISPRPLRRRRETGTLTSDESDRLCCWPRSSSSPIGPSIGKLRPVSGSALPYSLLGDASPLDHVDTMVGMDQVKTMLVHVDHRMPT